MEELRHLALELLEKYYEAETAAIDAYSGRIDEDLDGLEAEAASYRERIDSIVELARIRGARLSEG